MSRVEVGRACPVVLRREEQMRVKLVIEFC